MLLPSLGSEDLVPLGNAIIEKHEATGKYFLKVWQKNNFY